MEPPMLDKIIPTRSVKQGPRRQCSSWRGSQPRWRLPLFIVDLSTALGNTVFLFAGDVNMEIPGFQTSQHLSLVSSAWTRKTKCDLSINCKPWSCKTVFKLCLHFSVENFKLLIPALHGVTYFGVSLDTAFTSSVHCKDALNIAEWFIFMASPLFYELF